MIYECENGQLVNKSYRFTTENYAEKQSLSQLRRSARKKKYTILTYSTWVQISNPHGIAPSTDYNRSAADVAVVIVVLMPLLGMKYIWDSLPPNPSQDAMENKLYASWESTTRDCISHTD